MKRRLALTLTLLLSFGLLAGCGDLSDDSGSSGDESTNDEPSANPPSSPGTPPAPTPDEDTDLDVSLTASATSGTAPLQVVFDADVSGDADEDAWYINDREIEVDGLRLTYTFRNAGEYLVTYSAANDQDEVANGAVTVRVSSSSGDDPGTPTDPEPPADPGTPEDPAPTPNPPVPPSEPTTPAPPGEPALPPTEPTPPTPPEEPAPGETTGTLNLDVTPDGSSWSIAGQSGAGDKTLTLSAGTFDLTVTPPAGLSYRASTQPVTITAGGAQSVSVVLEPNDDDFLALPVGGDDDGPIPITQGGTFSVSVGGPEDLGDVGPEGFPNYRVTLQGLTPDALKLTPLRNYREADRRIFVYRTDFDPAVAGQTLEAEATSDSPFNVSHYGAIFTFAGTSEGISE